MAGVIHWLASYPKSGNTWMRILLTNYFRNADVPADINDLDGGPIASARAVFDDNVGIEASDLTQDEIERLRPAVYEQISEAIVAERKAGTSSRGQDSDAMPPIFKVHDAYTSTVDGVPLLSKRATAGAIYIIRDPIDIVPSFAHHMGTTIERAIAALGSEQQDFVSSPDRLHIQLRQRTLSWSGHVRSWVDEPDLKRIVVRYEDMIDDTAAQLCTVLEFLGVTADSERVSRAVEFSSFGGLRTQEDQGAFRERSANASSFFRSGTVGDGHRALTPAQRNQVYEDHSEVMERFGYSPR